MGLREVFELQGHFVLVTCQLRPGQVGGNENVVKKHTGKRKRVDVQFHRTFAALQLQQRATVGGNCPLTPGGRRERTKRWGSP